MAIEKTKVVTGSIEGFTPPSKPTGGNAAKYPFDDLEPGEFFSVIGRTKRQLASPLGHANRKYRTELTDVEGKVVSKTQEREFYAVDVDAATAKKLKGTAHEHATVLVIRSK